VTAILIYRYIARRINTTHALLGALFFLTIPVIVRLSSTVYVDLGLICFLFASLLYLFDWIESKFKIRPLLFSAICCGLALGVKYNGLLGLFLLGLFVPFVYARFHAGTKQYGIRAVGWCAVFVITSLLVFSPWMIRSIAWTGNPVYPLYNSVFNPETSPEEKEKTPDTVLEERGRMTHIQIRKEIYNESWYEIALIPLRVFFQGQDDTPKYFDGRTNPFLLILPIFAFLGFRARSAREKTEMLLMLCFSVLFLLYACAQTSIRIRYFSPIIPPLVVLSMFGLYNIRTRLLQPYARLSGSMKNLIVFTIITAMLGLNAVYMAERFQKDQPLTYISGKATRDEYIQAFRPEYAAFQYANEHLDEDAKIFGLYIGNRGYYSDRHIEFPIALLQKSAAHAESGQDIAEMLHGKGFTHLLVNVSLFNFWVQKYTLHERQMLKQFFDAHTVVEFSQDKHSLLRIR
jgi:4-amino-4-deoxy-L-arabinose transferase-like glycosyltransferase